MQKTLTLPKRKGISAVHEAELVELVGKEIVRMGQFRRHDDAFIYELQCQMHETDTPVEALNTALTALKQRGYESPRIYRRIEDICELVTGLDLPPGVKRTSFPLTHPILHHLFNNGTVIYHNRNIYTDPSLICGEEDPSYHTRGHGLIAVRYGLHSHLLGRKMEGALVVNYDSRSKNHYSQKKRISQSIKEGREFRILDQVGWLVADNVVRLLELGQYQRINQQLALQASLDGLTGIYNKSTFFHHLESALVSGNPHYLVLVDFDHFKEVNDHFGHYEGDHVLRGIGDYFRRKMEDAKEEGGTASQQIFPQAYRIGGDEFALILRLSTSGGNGRPQDIVAQLEQEQKVSRYVEEIWQGIHHLYVPSESVPLSASLGICFGQEGRFNDHEEWYKQADAILYEAKRSGRDRFFFQGIQG